MNIQKSLVLCFLAAAPLTACASASDGVSSSADEVIPETWLSRGTTLVGEERSIPFFGPIANAALYALSESSLTTGYQGAVLINPGAVVRSADVKTLAESIARKGYITYVANNPDGDVNKDQGGPAKGPIPLLAGGFIPNLAHKLSSNPRDAKALPDPIVKVHERWNAAGTPKLVAIGHSLGGAVLGDAAGRKDTGLSRIILIGVDQLVDAFVPFGLTPPSNGATPVPLVFVRGELDGLAEAGAMKTLSAKYSNSTLLPAVRGANHFCIIDGDPGDPKAGKVGAPGKRIKDGTATLPTVQACVDATILALESSLK